jgi:ABC-type cobalamin/Fe3+-siderophores transport system ATPase subunit
VTQPGTPLLTLTDVKFGFDDRPDFLGPISLAVHPLDCWGIIGPNGAGKSTLLRLMAGLLTPRSGSVRLLDRPLHTPARGRGPKGGPHAHEHAWSLSERARHIAFVPQQAHNDVAMSVREVVLMGRFPHRTLGLFESPLDDERAEWALGLTRTDAFAARALATLSGGEAQRVHVAAAIAQETEVLLLDEPTASLDLQFQIDMFRLLRDQAAEQRQGVVVVTHDVNLAGAFCNKVLLLHDGRCVAQGSPDDVIRRETLERAYGVDMVALSFPDADDRSQDTGAACAPRRWFVPGAAGARADKPAHADAGAGKRPDQGGSTA